MIWIGSLTCQSTTGSTILGITYGIDVQLKDDPFVLLAEKALHSMAAVGNVGAYMGKCFIPEYIPRISLLL